MQTTWDLIAIGGGTAGMAAVRQARRAGRSALLIQAGEIGGDCTFTGCVPSKTLIEAAAQGLTFEAAMLRAREVVAEIAATENASVFRGEGISVLEDSARLVGGGGVAAGGHRLSAARIVLATGTRPREVAVPGLTDPLTNETLWSLTKAPASLAVLGGGPIGCELAQAMARLGVPTTLVEQGDQLLPKEEPEAAAVVTAALRRDGVDVRLATSAASHAAGELTLSSGAVVPAEAVLVAVGREAVTESLGLTAAGVALRPDGYVATNSRLATSARGIYAAGDLTGRLAFTHAADEMGRTAALNAFAPVDWLAYSTRAVPWVTFTAPEVGRVGLTEAQASARVRGARVAELPMSQVDRAVAAGETEGYLKIIAGPRLFTRGALGGRVLGCTAVCARGGELVHEAALAMKTGMFTGRLAQTSHAYPSWSVAVQQVAGQFFLEINGRRARPARG